MKSLLYQQMKNIFIILISLLITNEFFGQNKFGIGIGGSPDFNFYKYSNYQFSYNEKSTNKMSVGFSFGLVFNYKLNDKIDLYSNLFYSEKKYFPFQYFNCGLLKNVKTKTIDIPVNIKYNLNELNDWMGHIYLLGGLTYQIELYNKASFDFFNGYDESDNFVNKDNSMLFNIGLGYEKKLNENTIFRSQLNYRLGKHNSEFLNRWIDKVAIEVVLIKTFREKK